MTAPKDCPCGSSRPYSACCEPFIKGKAQPATAEALMRSRYSAFVVGDVGYVEKTHDPETRKDGFDRAGAEKWSKESQWKGLQIVATKDGGEGDEKGVVSFRALFNTGGSDYVHQEISTFRRLKGNWVFVDGVSPKAETFEKKGPDVGRNDPCHCGSGKKFKKCHGRA